MLFAVVLAGCGIADSSPDDEQGPRPVPKTNGMHIYVHYMPWFHSRDVSGYWGSHWRMANRNPDRTDEEGRREIAAHYYPLIGPYDSRDPDVIEYHLLLMKYAGVDAVLIDWYGTHSVHDYRTNLGNSNAIIERIDDVGLQFAVVYEEFTAGVVGQQTGKTAIEAAQEDVVYLKSNYFSSGAYLRVDDQPLLMTFGPRHFLQATQWNEILDPLEANVTFLPLWGHVHRVGDNADGEFSWIDFTPSLDNLGSFYRRNSTGGVKIGSAYPRFHDFYVEGDWGESYGRVLSNAGQTMRRTLELAQEHGLAYVQLATWNDFGEGTAIEPTIEDGFLFLEIVQQFTGVPYDRSELELIHNHFLKRKEYKGDAEKELLLKQVFDALVALDVQHAHELLNAGSGL